MSVTEESKAKIPLPHLEGISLRVKTGRVRRKSKMLVLSSIYSDVRSSDIRDFVERLLTALMRRTSSEAKWSLIGRRTSTAPNWSPYDSPGTHLIFNIDWPPNFHCTQLVTI
jgi:hypothetical protein